MNNEQELDIRQIIKTMIKRRTILLYIMIASLILGVIYTFIINRPKYQSTSKILIDKNAASIAEYVNSNDIITEVAIGLNISKNRVQGAVIAEFDAKTMVITITSSSTSNQEAYDIIMKYNEVLKSKLETTYGVKVYTPIEQAQVSNSAYNVTYMKDLLMFLVGGVVVCGVYSIYLVMFSGDNIYSAIENSKTTFLGKVDKEEKAKTKVKSYISKNEITIAQVKRIMTSIELNKRLTRPKSILVTGTNYEVGSTYLVSNLAIRYSKIGKKVLVIDSNFEKGILNKIFNIKTEKGLTDLVASKQINMESIAKVIKQSPINNIYVLPSGEEAIDEELLISEKVSEIIKIVTDQFDVVIIDGEPILKQITSYGWASSVNATVIVAEYAKTRIEDIVKAKHIITDVNGKVSGVVVNKAE